MLRRNFSRSFRNQYDRGRRSRSPEFRRTGSSSRLSPRDNDLGMHYGPREHLDQRDLGQAARFGDSGQRSPFGTPSEIQGGRNPQMQLFPSPAMSGSTQNPFAFAGVQGIPQSAQISGDQKVENSGLPNFQFLVAPGNYPSIQNPFSVSGSSALQNFKRLLQRWDIQNYLVLHKLGNFGLQQMLYRMLQIYRIRIVR